MKFSQFVDFFRGSQWLPNLHRNEFSDYPFTDQKSQHKCNQGCQPSTDRDVSKNSQERKRSSPISARFLSFFPELVNPIEHDLSRVIQGRLVS